MKELILSMIFFRVNSCAAASGDDSDGGTDCTIVISTPVLEAHGQLIYKRVNIVYDISQGPFMWMVQQPKEITLVVAVEVL